VVIATVRFWASVPILLVATRLAGQRITRETVRHTWLAGSLFGLNMTAVFFTLQHASVAVMAVLMALQPGVVLVLAGPWLGERATRWHVFWTIVGIGGVCVVILGNGPEVEIEALGLAGGVVSLLSFTGYYLRNRQVRTTAEIHPLEWMSGSTIFSAIFVTPFAVAFTEPADYRLLAGLDWLYLFYVAGVVGIFSHTLMSWVQKFIPATRSSLYLLGMTVVAVLAAWPINGEPVTLQQLVGGLIVLGAVAAVVSRPPAQVGGDEPSAGPRVRSRAQSVYAVEPAPVDSRPPGIAMGQDVS
jgi:drug/metabolite transporter (DMT)-like permease